MHRRLALLLAASTFAMPASAAWRIHNVDATGQVGFDTSIAVDSQGQLHVSYARVNGTDEDLMYARRNTAGIWSTETVLADGRVGRETSIAVTSLGIAHISHIDVGTGTVLYTSGIPGNWTHETVDPTGEATGQTSIALDPLGAPHITYYAAAFLVNDLGHARKMGNGWEVGTLDEPSITGVESSAAVDAEGTLHVSYHDLSNGDLRYAFRWNDIWFSQSVDTDGVVGRYTSLALGPDDEVHMAYFDETEGHVMYAVEAGTSWDIEPVGPTAWPGLRTSIAVDGSGVAHVAYHDDAAGALIYARHTANGFLRETVDTGGVGWMSDLALGTAGTVHISYYDAANGDLQVASRSDLLPPLDVPAAQDRVGRLLAVPSPFSGGELRLHVPTSAVQVDLFDTAGRRIRTLGGRASAHEAGILIWDGRDDRGARVPAGVYLAVAAHGRDRSTEKIVVVP